MFGSVKKSFLPSNLKAFFKELSIRCAGLLLILCGSLTAGALVTYDISDPSFNTASGSVPKNALGHFGACLSDLLWQYCGLTAVFLPLALTAWGVIVFRLKWSKLSFLRVLCFFPTTVVLMMLFAGIFPTLTTRFTPAGLGGALASAFYLPLMPYVTFTYFPYPQAVILPVVFVLAVFGCALTLGIPFPFLKKCFLDFILSLKSLCLLVWRLIRRKKTTETDDAVHDLPEDLPESVMPVQEEFDLKNGSAESVPVPKKRDTLRSMKEHKKYMAEFHLPKTDFLAAPDSSKAPQVSKEFLDNQARRLEEVLEEFGVRGRIVNVRPGPVVTLFELEPAPGIKTTRVINLADDIARSMSAISVRIAVVPGQSVIGIEMPNERRAPVYLREMLACDEFKHSQKALTLALGKDIGGTPTFTDLAKMPHLLIAGTTGSGKSVAINTMILSLLYRLTPEQCRLIMIDPKMLELSVYNGIPHLLTPVVTDPKKAVLALNWAVREMDDRYLLMSQMGVRNIDGYNKKVKEILASGVPTTRTVQTGFDPETGAPVYEEQPLNLKPFPYIVVIVDEMADLMLTAGKDVEVAIQRIAQKARASGIHLIMATQRPSVDVITGTIKANFPERISFRVTTKIDSRTILGEQGAEQLLGMGDMLYLAQGQRAKRLHGPFVSDEEVERVASYLREQAVPEYVEAVTEETAENGAGSNSFALTGDGSGDENSLYDKAVNIVLRDRKVSTSYIQRQLRIGYNRAADLIDRMETEGVISAPNHAGKREILVPERS